ncbi:unnamed protein product [Dibothriocephalus latus]|uniref:Uncharacterized protein n=1 Tax=Dibothriocephalus latus TaxID=60516 RepID=A0A3P7LUD8_DIBLA|nr:unnamed protein product [Dibothriocephalus latus]
MVRPFYSDQRRRDFEAQVSGQPTEAGQEESFSCSFSSAASGPSGSAPFFKVEVLVPASEPGSSSSSWGRGRNSPTALTRTFIESTGEAVRKFFCGSTHSYSFEDQRNILEYETYASEDDQMGRSGDLGDDCELGEVRRQHIVMTGEVWNSILTKAPKLIPTVRLDVQLLLGYSHVFLGYILKLQLTFPFRGTVNSLSPEMSTEILKYIFNSNVLIKYGFDDDYPAS